MKRTTVFVLLVMTVMFLQAAPVWARGEVKEASKNLDMGFYSNAKKILDLHIKGDPENGVKGHPTDLDANFELGRYYLLVGNDKAAIERFNIVLNKDESYRSQIGEIYQEAAIAETQKEWHNCPRIYKLLREAYAYNPQLAIDDHTTGNKLIQYGDRARFQEQYGCAENFYIMAKLYGGENLSETIAHRLLYLGVLGYEVEKMKSTAELIVGKEFVSQVLPGAETIPVFEGTYTDANITEPNDDGGWIPTFDWAKVRTGTLTVIDGDIPQGCKQISYYRGEEFRPKYKPTKDGFKEIPITNRPKDGKFMIWMQKGKGITVTVRVIETIQPQPRTDLLRLCE